MNLKRTIGLILVIAGVILGVAKALGGQGQSGDWTLRRSDDPGKVEFSLMDSRAGHRQGPHSIESLFAGLERSRRRQRRACVLPGRGFGFRESAADSHRNMGLERTDELYLR